MLRQKIRSVALLVLVLAMGGLGTIGFQRVASFIDKVNANERAIVQLKKQVDDLTATTRPATTLSIAPTNYPIPRPEAPVANIARPVVNRPTTSHLPAVKPETAVEEKDPGGGKIVLWQDPKSKPPEQPSNFKLLEDKK